jgi:hypothetical protein
VQTSTVTFYEIAAPLTSRFSIIPIQPGKKVPFPTAGPTKATRDGAQITAWAEQFPDANVAIVADKEICILETDNLEQLRAAIKNGTGRDIPETLMACASSENRPHLYFKQTEKSRNVGNLQVPGLFEARWSNLYCVAPGSLHPDGSRYRWLNEAEIIPIPDWLVSELVRLALSRKKERTSPTVEVSTDGKVPEGSRHYYRMRELGRAWDGKKSEDEMVALALELNEQCDPPDAVAKVVGEVRDIMQKEPYDPGPAVVLGSGRPAVNPDDWRALFHTYDETVNAPPLRFAIEGFLQEDGITLVGGLAGHGKTLLMLNMAKVLLEGGSLFGYEPFQVTRKAARIIYLIPESGLGPFVHRLKIFGLLPHVQSGRFLYRTLSAREDVTLDDPRILRAVEGADVFLDTAVRFLPGDENSATDQGKFAKTLFHLQAAGARTITGAHHAPKSFETKEHMTLENALRGSGDIGAMAATCWVVKQTDKASTRLFVKNVKPRDFEPCEPFELEGRPHIDQTGQFAMSKAPGEADAPKVERLNKKAGQIEEARVMLAGGYSFVQIAQHIGVNEKTVRRWNESGQLKPDVRATDKEP